MRKTKIICTIGPASENAETLKKMCQAGMNVARLNFSHGTHEEQQNKINLIKQVRKELERCKSRPWALRMALSFPVTVVVIIRSRWPRPRLPAAPSQW